MAKEFIKANVSSGGAPVLNKFTSLFPINLGSNDMVLPVIRVSSTDTITIDDEFTAPNSDTSIVDAMDTFRYVENAFLDRDYIDFVSRAAVAQLTIVLLGILCSRFQFLHRRLLLLSREEELFGEAKIDSFIEQRLEGRVRYRCQA